MNPKCFCKRAKNKTEGGEINFANVILWCNWYQTIKSRMQIFHQNTLGIVNFSLESSITLRWKLFTF